MLRSYDNSAEELCEPERQADRGADGEMADSFCPSQAFFRVSLTKRLKGRT